MVLSDVAVGVTPRNGQSDSGAYQTVGLVCRSLRQNDEGDLPRLQFGLTLFHWNDFADRRIDRGDSNQILLFDSRIAQRQFKTLKFMDMPADAPREENFSGNHVRAVCKLHRFESPCADEN